MAKRKRRALTKEAARELDLTETALRGSVRQFEWVTPEQAWVTEIIRPSRAAFTSSVARQT